MMKKMVSLLLGLCVVSLLGLPLKANAEFSPKWGVSADFIGFRTYDADANADGNSTMPPTDVILIPAARTGVNSSTVNSIEVEATVTGAASLTKSSDAYLAVLAMGTVQGAANTNALAQPGGNGAATNAQQMNILVQQAYYHFNDSGFDVSFGIQGAKTGTFGRNYWHGINFGFNPDKGGAAALIFVPHPTTNGHAIQWQAGGIHSTVYRHVTAATNATPSVQASYSFGEIGKEGFNGKAQGFFAYPKGRVIGSTKSEVTYAGFYGGVGYGLTDSLGINADAVVSQYHNYASADNGAASNRQPDLADNVGGGLQVLFDLTSNVALTAGAMLDKSTGLDGNVTNLRRSGALYTAVVGGDFKNLCIGDKLFCLGSTGVFWQQTLNGRGLANIQGGGPVNTNSLARLPDLSHLHAEIENSWLWRWATAYAPDRPIGHFGNGIRSFAKLAGTFDVGHSFDWGITGEKGRQKAALTTASTNLGWGLGGSLGTKVGPLNLALASSWFNSGPAVSGVVDPVSYMLTVGF